MVAAGYAWAALMAALGITNLVAAQIRCFRTIVRRRLAQSAT